MNINQSLKKELNLFSKPNRLVTKYYVFSKIIFTLPEVSKKLLKIYLKCSMKTTLNYP